ncbi:MAG: cysteine desulfurase [Ignavibacteriae bacterium]|nr:cysteine desulfurase [Ignavibacteriota bacterium]
MRRVYLDHTATTPLDLAVLESMQTAFASSYGNASSIHSFGREARALLEESRETIAKFIGARPEEIYFTSGGTESNNYTIAGVASAAAQSGKRHVIVSAVEHHSVLHPAEALRTLGFTVDVIPVDRYGVVDLDNTRKLISKKTCLVSVMHANNEVGTIQPIQEMARIAHEHGAMIHTDAVQTVGKIPLIVDELHVDLLSMSAHKIYGPKGIGALYIRRGTKIDSLLKGGAQESNRRAGTQNVPLAVGFAKAVELASERMADDAIRFAQLRQVLKSQLAQLGDGVIMNGHPTLSLPNIFSVSFDSTARPIDGEALIMGMDLRGVAVTSGSACTSGSLEPSHVLLAMGRNEKTARATIRFSPGRNTTEDDLAFAVSSLRDVLETMKNVKVA